jgi:hypothetical protein
MAGDEFERIVAHLRRLDPQEALRVLNEEKAWVWFEEAQVQACHFYDMRKRQCLVYPVRPLVCRLFGRVEWLPCPLGRSLPQLRGGLELMQTYAAQRRATFPEWCSAIGVFDFRQLLVDGGQGRG